MRKTLILTLALALSLAGCIQNMGDLRERFGATTEEPLEQAAIESAPEAPRDTTAPNATPRTPPVARAAIFGANGALVYKTTFTAEDPQEIVFVDEKTKLTLNAADSEALEVGANLTGYAWTLDGKPVEGARTASIELPEPALYILKLVVTDSVGSTDELTLKLGVAPKEFEVVTDLATDALFGAGGQGEAATVPFALGPSGDKPVKVKSATFAARPGTGCDVSFDVVAPDGTSLGPKNAGGLGAVETLVAEGAAFGDYALTVSPVTCAAAQGVPLRVTVVYLHIVEGLEDTDGHAHAH